jgi:hypothetical protein
LRHGLQKQTRIGVVRLGKQVIRIGDFDHNRGRKAAYWPTVGLASL